MYKRMLVPLDGSELAETVLPHVRELAKSCRAELVLLRVAFAHIFPGANPIQAQVTAVQEAETYIHGVAKTLQDMGFKVEARVRYGDPAEEILDHVTWGHIDLIAMATHGRTGLKRLVLGSVAENVLRGTSVPVFLVCAAVAAGP
ncbi:MAG: universal stress protein [Nitrospinae bacterium]|nr:universal stress protein [Nitrospinota bacterium]